MTGTLRALREHQLESLLLLFLSQSRGKASMFHEGNGISAFNAFPKAEPVLPHKGPNSLQWPSSAFPGHSFILHSPSPAASMISKSSWGTGKGEGKHVVPDDIRRPSRWPLLPLKEMVCVCGPSQREHCWLLFVSDYLRSPEFVWWIALDR